jgi:DNA-binding CsgD family transcriptional regulator
LVNVQKMAAAFRGSSSERHLAKVMDSIAAEFGATSYGVTRFGSAEHGACLNTLTTYPSGYQDTFDGVDYSPTIDPVMQHLRLFDTPIMWGRDTYVRAGHARMYEPMSDFGLRCGAAVALHLEPHRHFVLALNWDASHKVPACQQFLSRLHVCAALAENAFYRVWGRTGPIVAPAGIDLTNAECEALYWVGRGLSDSAMGARFGLSPRTIEKRVQSAMEKLRATNRTEAAVTATRLELTEQFHYMHGRRFSNGNEPA